MGILRKIVSNLRSILTTSCNWIKNNKVRLIKFFKWAMLTLVFCYFYISYSRVTVEFEVSNNSEEQDAVYLFYDNNSFEYPFDDEHLYTFKNIGVDYQQVTARIPRYAVYKIRIDFGSRAGTYCLKNLKMIFPHKIYTFSADDILRLFSNSGDISALEKITDTEMRIQVTGGDGNIYTTNSLKGLQSRFNVVCILGCVISGILAWGIMEYQKAFRLIRTAVGKIRQKVKIPQKIKALIFSKKSMVTAAIFLIIVIEIYTFASRMPFYSYDSSWYITYLDYFIGKKPITEWDPIRGFTFPLLLWFAYLLQPGSMGILAMLCCSYVIFSVYAFKILNLINQYCFNRSTSIGDCILLTLLLLFNPIIWSYYHLVLTECIAVTALFIYVYYAFKFYINRIQGTLSIMKYVFFVIFTGLMTIFCYFLKQNFLAITVFIIFISEFLILIKFRTKREFAYSLILVFCTVITLKTSISIWNNVIDYNTSEISAGFLQNIGRLRYFYPLDSQAGVTTISVRDNNYNEIDTFEYQFDDRFINRINFILVCFMKYPNRVLTGYLDNYLLMADLYQNKSWNGVTSYGPVTKGEPLKTLFSDFRIKSAATENKTLAVKSLYSVYYDSESYINTHIQHFKELNMYSEVLEKYKGKSTVKMQNMTTDFLTNDFVMKLCFVIYAIVFVCAPFLLIYFLHLYLKEKTIKSFFFTIITFYAVAFVLLHVAVGNVIDRYALPAYAILLYTPFLCVNRMKLKIQTYKIIITKKE